MLINEYFVYAVKMFQSSGFYFTTKSVPSQLNSQGCERVLSVTRVSGPNVKL